MKLTTARSSSFLAAALVTLPLVAPSVGQDDAPADGAPTANSTVSVTPFSISVHRDPGIDGVTTFDNPGFSIKAIVEVPDRPFVQLVDDACVVRRFADDTGRDLAPGMDEGFFNGITLGSRFDDDDPSKGVLEIRTQTLPAPGSTSVKLDATAVLLSARDLTEASAAVAFTKGTTFEVGGLSFEVSSVEPVEDDGWGDAVQQIDLRTSDSLDAVKEWVLLDDKGEVVEWDDLGTMTFGSRTKKTITRSLGPHRALTSGTIRLSYYETLEEVEVPLVFEVGIGL